MGRQASMQCFMVVWAVLSALLGVLVLSTEKMALHQVMLLHHSSFADRFFSVITHVADGWVPTAISILLLTLSNVRSFLMMGLSCGFSALITQFLKQVVFPLEDRPFMFKSLLGDLHWVDGLEHHHHFSFPSGHATAAFSMCCALAVLLARPRYGGALALLAALLAYSRVYLSQHFTEDILAGAAIGTVGAYLVYHWLYRSAFSSKPWLERRLFYRK